MELASLSIVGLITIALLSLWAYLEGHIALLRESLLSGFLLAVADLFVEFLGTTMGKWVYVDSVLFLGERVPVELVPIFFSLGMLITFVYELLNQSEWDISLSFSLNIIILLGVSVYFFRTLNDQPVALVMISVPLGIWGLMQIDERRMRALSIMIAGFVGVADYVVEVMIINSGGYGYSSGFRVETPLTYSMVIIAIFGVIEWGRKRQTSTSLPDAVS